MVHLGDITKIKGCNAPVVDCIIGGSPCQDLSVAGKRAGLAGERSGLYMEQIRIIKEMRHKDELRGRTGESIRPRYMVWENVPGAFSSNQGKDFAAVLEEAIRVADPEAPNVPVPEKGWPTAGCLMGDSWSVAWRVLDAQFWGVPQRRRRIALVADFGGQSAPEILFVRKGVSRDLDESQQERKAAARDAKNRSGAADREGEGFDGYNGDLTGQVAAREGGHIYEGVSGTLRANAGDNQMTVAYGITDRHVLDDQGGSQISVRHDGKCPTLRAEMHGNVPCVMEPKTYDARGNGDGKTANTLTGDHNNRITDYSSVVVESQPVYCLQGNGIDRADTAGCNGAGWREGQSYTLNTIDRPAVAYCTDVGFFNSLEEVSPTLLARSYKDPHLVSYPQDVQYIVRRLTPLECERLQGFPDHWTDIGEWIDSKGKKHKEADSPRYKALGNSIAIPPWKWVLKRICACYERDATMASLFDGIGGFPYIWEQINGKGSCLWASEIEEFPMAVTKLRFSE